MAAEIFWVCSGIGSSGTLVLALAEHTRMRGYRKALEDEFPTDSHGCKRSGAERSKPLCAVMLADLGIPAEVLVQDTDLKARKVRPNPMAALGFAKEHGLEVMPTDEWMAMVREDEEDWRRGATFQPGA